MQYPCPNIAIYLNTQILPILYRLSSRINSSLKLCLPPYNFNPTVCTSSVICNYALCTYAISSLRRSASEKQSFSFISLFCTTPNTMLNKYTMLNVNIKFHKTITLYKAQKRLFKHPSYIILSLLHNITNLNMWATEMNQY